MKNYLTINSQVEAERSLAGRVLSGETEHAGVFLGQLLHGDVGEALRLLDVDHYVLKVLFKQQSYNKLNNVHALQRCYFFCGNLFG